MNQDQKLYESYPVGTVLTANLLSLATYTIGAYILFQTGWIWMTLYIICIFVLEFSLYKKSCAYCFYYGKLCAFGKGKIAPFFVKRSDPNKFCERKITWIDLLPQILVSLIPIGVGVYLLIQEFSLLILILILIPILIWLFGNPIIYGKLACPHCKQGQICCPASKFFKPNNKEKNEQ
ncbi:hypothetical protein ACFL14_00600 [Patescibacteria group bacterium]